MLPRNWRPLAGRRPGGARAVGPARGFVLLEYGGYDRGLAVRTTPSGATDTSRRRPPSNSTDIGSACSTTVFLG